MTFLYVKGNHVVRILAEPDKAHRHGVMRAPVGAGKLAPQQRVGCRIDLAEGIPPRRRWTASRAGAVGIIDRF